MPILTAAVCGLGCLLIYLGMNAGAYFGCIAAFLCLAVSGEMILRALAGGALLAALAHNLGTLVVMANAGRLLKFQES